jgi:transposase
VFCYNLVLFTPKVDRFHNAMFIRSREKSRNKNAAGWLSVVELCRRFNCRRNTVHELVRRYRLTGDVQSHPRPGRPRATSQRDDRAIVLTRVQTGDLDLARF